MRKNHNSAGKKICRIFDNGIAPPIVFSEKEVVEGYQDRGQNDLQRYGFKISSDDLMPWDRLKSNIYLSVKRQFEDNVLKKSYLNLEAVIKLTFDMGFGKQRIITVSRSLAETIGVSEEELWRTAEQNTRDSTVITRLSEFLGIDDDDQDGGPYMASAREHGGASVLLLPDVFAHFCKEHNENDCYILPSSTEEVIILCGSTVRKNISIWELAGIVEFVNNENVDPIMQLDPVVYQFSLSENSIRIVANA